MSEANLRARASSGAGVGDTVSGPPRLVALGGGHGLAASLAALRRLTPYVTGVVTVADDGGSSGRLRRELGALPPGDLRMALAALAGEDRGSRRWATLLQHRFGGTGALAGHPVGNLLITGLAETGLDDDPARLHRIRGQVAVATTPGRVVSVSLLPTNPPACPEAVAAVRSADAVVLGPGSWFTSVLPHVLVPDLLAALVGTAAHRIVALNLAPQPGETDGFSPEQHLEVLCSHAPGMRVDAVVADVAAVSDPDVLRSAVTGMGARLVLAPVAAGDGTPRHDPERLAAALTEVMCGTGTGVVDRWR